MQINKDTGSFKREEIFNKENIDTKRSKEDISKALENTTTPEFSRLLQALVKEIDRGSNGSGKH